MHSHSEGTAFTLGVTVLSRCQLQVDSVRIQVLSNRIEQKARTEKDITNHSYTKDHVTF